MVLAALLLSFAYPALSYAARTPTTQQTSIKLPVALPGFRYSGQLNGDVPVVGVVYVPLRNLNLLFYYAEAVNTPGSPLYHHFLTRQQVEELFYPRAEFKEALSYVESAGLRVLFTASDSFIVFEGTAAQVERAFNVSIGLFTNGTASYYAVTSVRGCYSVYVSNVTPLIIRRFQLTLKGIPRPNLSEVYSGIEAYPLTQVVNAYNVTPLYDSGYLGQNVSVGVLDFYGDPTIAQDLAYYDQLFGLPPANLTIVPIGPYDPNLGILTGWNGEIELDVETVHTVAPEAHIVLYIANGALPLAPIIAYIDQQDAVSIVTQSFGMDESAFSYYGAPIFYYNVYLSDVYYALGSAEGITFLASSGDGGGMGYSAGPVGDVGYPAASPWVLAVGGTTTYISGNLTLQTAWSAAGFVPYMFNFGGSTGGYSDVEPMPWWQAGVAPMPPKGFPLGRATPDVSANANIFPGIIIVTEYNQTVITGGTSEASPLTAGLLALIESRLGHRVGLIGPTFYWLYQHGGSAAFEPITFGYNIPWTINGSGYNLVTGLGAINAGELVHELLKAASITQGLSIEVSVNATGSQMLLPGQVYVVEANVTYPNGTEVRSGAFRAQLETVFGPALTVSMTYNSTLGLWVARLVAPSNASGVTFVTVSGSSGGLTGVSFAEEFLGYFASVLSPAPVTPYEPQLGIPLLVNVTLVNGTPVSVPQVPLTVYIYDPLTNTYSPVYNASTSVNELQFNSSAGYALLEVGGPAYAFVPFYVGSCLQMFYVLPEDFGMPGVASPGQYLFITGYVIPPVETFSAFSYSTGYSVAANVMYASNVTALLVAPNGTVVSSAEILPNQMEVPSSLTTSSPVFLYQGFLQVPPNARSGYYKVILVSSYNSTTLGIDITGEALDMIYVTEPLLVSAWTEPQYPAEGQTLTIYANITYVNGTPVRFGDFSATLVPEADYGAYWQMALSLTTNVMLYYNSTLGLWEGQAVLPSPFSPGYTTFNGLYAGEPWVAVIAGTGAFNPIGVGGYSLVIPESKYVLYTGLLTPGSFYPYDALFYDANITGYSGPIENSIMEGSVYIVDSNVVLSGVNATGVLYVVDSNVTLEASHVVSVVLVNGTLNLFIDDMVGQITGSGKVNYVLPTELYMINSTLAKIAPELSNLTRLAQEVNETYALYRLLSSELAGNVSALYARIGELNATLQRYYSSLQSAISSLTTDVATLRSYLSGNVSAISYQVSQLNDTLGLERDEIALLSRGLTNVNSTLSAELASLRSYLSGNVSAINGTLTRYYGQLSSDIAAVNSTLSADVGLLRSQLQQVNATYEGLYSGLRQGLGSAESQINNLSAQLSEVRSALASKANTTSVSLSGGVGALGLVIAAAALYLVMRRR